MINTNPKTIKDAKRLCKFVRRMLGMFLDDDTRIDYDPDLREYYIRRIETRDGRRDWYPIFRTGTQDEMSRWLVNRSSEKI